MHNNDHKLLLLYVVMRRHVNCQYHLQTQPLAVVQ